MIKLLLIIVPLILSIMLYTLAERKVQASIQMRVGPNIVGPYGILQPLTDGLKLLFKEILIPQRSYLIIFTLSPLLSFLLSLALWLFYYLLDSYLGILILLAIGGLELYGILLGGWASKNKYTLVGAIRTTSQLISYELILGMIYFILALSIGSFRFYYFNLLPINNLLIYLPLYLITLIVILAETNRVPFDLPESESETVAGFFVEHSAIIFALYFLAEYSNMIFLSYLFSVLYTSSLILLPIHLFYYLWIRATLPRLRYDHLILLSWYNLLPITLAFLILSLSIITSKLL
uniref:NADH dehydrogenase subunit 1 n=1 Tax=Amoeboaphelidium protococcarum TaxID=1243177 RepID=UPI00223891CC|nr:NADH dehydrogenase subunit 1 [Amoeboaphelidium protococcarum]UYP50895.1 NADH dehydrogenase subunit 1 [Amoeboaphelidium protococcarum]UYP50918.1 NADH dehydrogenase subunit 1 [Amoeboaphelidium protococcarum]